MSTTTGAKVTVSFNGAPPVPCEFSVHTERIDVSSLTASKPDMSWTFVDAAGHFHAYDHEGNLPTIVRREERIEPEPHEEEGNGSGGPAADESDDWDEYDDDEAYTITHIECGLCGEKIEPKRLPDDPHKSIPGRTEYKVTVHAEVLAGRISVLINTPGRLWFGFGQGYPTRVDYVHGNPQPTYEVFCGPMSWRPTPVAPEGKPADVWAGVRDRLKP